MTPLHSCIRMKHVLHAVLALSKSVLTPVHMRVCAGFSDKLSHHAGKEGQIFQNNETHIGLVDSAAPAMISIDVLCFRLAQLRCSKAAFPHLKYEHAL